MPQFPHSEGPHSCSAFRPAGLCEELGLLSITCCITCTRVRSAWKRSDLRCEHHRELLRWMLEPRGAHCMPRTAAGPPASSCFLWTQQAALQLLPQHPAAPRHNNCSGQSGNTRSCSAGEGAGRGSARLITAHPHTNRAGMLELHLGAARRNTPGWLSCLSETQHCKRGLVPAPLRPWGVGARAACRLGAGDAPLGCWVLQWEGRHSQW